MKQFFTIFIFAFISNILSAQEKHFVFIQADNKQPFYVSVEGKLYSSTATGYLIIPKLADGSYNFTIGFAQNAFPEQTFTTVVQNKDLGFELKNFGEKGWGLFNLQSLDITMATTANTDVVAKALSQISSPKTVEPVISFPQKKIASEPPKLSSDTAVGQVTTNAEVAGQPVKAVDSSVLVTEKTVAESPGTVAKAGDKNESGKTAGVKKVSEVTNEEGGHLAFVEANGKSADTIQVVIPSVPAEASPAAKAPSTAESGSSNGKMNSSTPEGMGSPAAQADKNDLKFLDMGSTAGKDSSKVLPVEPSKIMENSNCTNIATDDDYAKLRKKMAVETSDEKMIGEARKYYKNKCFTTEQIKRLSTLFLSDEGRFNFFNASLASVADATQYHTLQTEFIDPAFVTRFKNLLNK